MTGREGDPIGPHTLATMHLPPINYPSALLAGDVQRAGVTGLSMRPSEYLRRSIRVTPFWQEPVGEIISRYNLGDVLWTMSSKSST